MKYLLYDLGTVKAGDTVEISLGYAANVRLIDSENYELYKQKIQHRFTGGYIERSPYKVTIQDDGHWYVIIDSGSFFAKIKALVKLRPAAGESEDGRGVSNIEPEVCDRSSEKVEPTEDFPAAVSKNKYKVFILHYYKDRNSAAAALTDALTAVNLPVFYEDFTLEPGDDLAEKIKDGLTKYKFGVVIFSKSMLRASWKASDIRYVKELLTSDYRVLYPVWYNLMRNDVGACVPELADLVPRNAGDKDLTTIVEEIIDTLWL
jgi:hypothetical protein